MSSSAKNIHVSIIIPLYRVEDSILRCLKSIACQSFTDFEVVLVDDASPDDSLRLAENYLKQRMIQYQSIVHHSNKKQGTARNNGIKKAKGEYIIFVDGDDELSHENVLSEYVRVIQLESYDFVESNFYTISNEEVQEKQTFTEGITCKSEISSKNILLSFLRKKIFVSPCNKMISKDFLLKNSISFPEGMSYEDNIWAFNLFRKANKILCIPMYSYNYYLTNPNSTTGSFSEEKLNDLYVAISRIIDLIDSEKLGDKIDKCLLRDYIMRLVDGLLYRATEPKDKLFWYDYFSKMKTTFEKCSISDNQRFFKFPRFLQYHLYRHRKFIDDSEKYMGKSIHKGLIRILFLYSFEGIQTVAFKFRDKIFDRNPLELMKETRIVND